MPRKGLRRELEDAEDAEEALPRRRKRPRRRRRFLAFVAVLAALVVAGPTIVGRTPLRNLLLSSALPAGAAQLTARDGSFSWVAGQSLAGVTLTDAAGTPVATIEQATIDRSLVALAVNNRHLGKIVVTRPVVHLETRAGGSNIEELIQRLADAAAAPLPQPEGEPSPPTLAELEIIDGTILGRDAVTGQAWRVDGLALTAKPGDGGVWESSGTGVLTLVDAESTSAAASSAVAAGNGFDADAAVAGRFKFHYHPTPASTHQLDVIADRVPLGPLEPWLARIVPAARIVGVSSADLKLTWSAPVQTTGSAGGLATAPVTEPASVDSQPTGGAGALQRVVTAAGKLDVADVRFSAEVLSGDLVEVREGSIAVDASIAGSRLTARQLKAHSEWLEMDAAGAFDLAQLTSLALDRLPANDAALTANVDLPQVARMLPRTMRLRPGVRIDSGRLEASARSERDDAGRRWKLDATVADLVGHDGRRAIRWNNPVEASIDLAEAPAGPQLKRIVMRSPFASVLADGAEGGLEGELQFNLEQLAAQMGQFVDLSAWQLRGTGTGKFSWRDTGPGTFAASADLDLRQINVSREGKLVWVDPEVHMELQSSGQRLAARPLRFETATALMRGPRDTLELELLEPVDLAAARSDWFVRIKGEGPLDSWAGRLRPWIAAVPDELAGESTVNARVRLGDELMEVTQSQVSVRDFRTRIGETKIVEPRIEAGGDFRWDATRRAIESQDLQVTSSTVAARARNVDVRLVEAGPPTVRGEVAYRGDLERIATWAGLVGAPSGMWPRGQGVGRIQLTSDAERASASVTLTAKPFALVRSASAATNGPPIEPAVAWNEPSLEFASQIEYVHADDRLQLTNLRLDGSTIKLTGSGGIDALRTAGVVRGDVTVTYDAGELAKLLATYLGPGVRLQGAAPLRLAANGRLDSATAQRGAIEGIPAESVSTSPRSRPSVADAPRLSAHWSRRLQLTADSGWTAANFYGLPIGQANVTATVRDGQIQFSPLDLAVGQGRLTAQPRVVLDPAPQALQLAAGPLVSNVAVSAEVSDAMLKYAAPILASATRISGTFSLITEGVTVPLGDPKQATTRGRLTMHQLAILPGPGLGEVVTLIQRLEQISRGRENLFGALTQPARPVKGITMNERTIDLQVVDGRVYHRNLEFLIDDVPVSSYGSVGFDQTIALVIRVPVQAKWVGSEPALQGLIGQAIEIPVSGTFTRWKVDERAVGQFVAQAAQSAVGGALGNEINKALDGLFRPK